MLWSFPKKSISPWLFTDPRNVRPKKKWVAGEGEGGSSLDRARYIWSGYRGFDPLARSNWVGMSILWPAEIEVMVFPLCLFVAARKICQTLEFGAVRELALVVDADL